MDQRRLILSAWKRSGCQNARVDSWQTHRRRAIVNTLKFRDIDRSEFDGVFFPGALGQLWDLASDSKVIRSIEQWIRESTPVAMVCHAPAILRDAKKPNGEP